MHYLDTKEKLGLMLHLDCHTKQPQQHSSTCVEGGHSLGFPIVRGLIKGLQISPVDFKKMLKINRSTDFGQN
jgi:hypothetical protein